MDINSFHWALIGMALMGLEMFLPGVIFLWLGLAALSVSVIDYIYPLTLGSQLTCFAVLSLIMTLIGRGLFAQTKDELPEESPLNRRADQMIGRTLTLTQPIINGEGKTNIGDSVWTIRGPDLAEGTKVVITGFMGNALLVKPKEDAPMDEMPKDNVPPVDV